MQRAGQPLFPAGFEDERGGEILDRVLSAYGEADRGGAGQPEPARDEAALRLFEDEPQRQHPGLVVEAAVEGEERPGAVDALGRKRCRALAVREARGAGHRQHQLLAHEGGTEFEPGHGQLAHLDRDRQFRQREGPRFGRGKFGHGVGIGDRRPQDGDALGGEPLDLQPPGEKRRPGPVQRQPLGFQPDALGIGDGEPGDGRLRGQGAFEADHPHLAARARQAVLQEPLQPPRFVVLGEGGAGQKAGPEDEQQAPHQKACPMPM